MKADKVLVVDVEATCWSGQPPKGEYQEIIEIGVVPVDLMKMEIGQGESIYVRPGRSTLSPFCTELTGITHGILRENGVTYDDAIKRLTSEYDSRICTLVSWGDFDRNMFWKGTDLYGSDFPFHKTHFNIKYFFSMWQGGAKLYGLGKALKKMGIEFEGRPHCGKDDAYNTAKILIEMLKSFKFARDFMRR